MRRPRLMIALVLTIFIFSSMLVGAQENRPQPDGQQGLEMYVATVDDSEVAPLRDAGYDVVHAKKVSSGTEVSMVLSPAEYEQLDSRFNLRLWQSDDGQTSTDLANAIEQDGDGVWKPFDGDDGFLTEMETIVEEYPNLVKRVDIGESVQGRPIVALKVTENANTVADNTRPAVLYISLQHAREWITGEMNLRLLRYLLDEYTAENTEIQSLLQTNEVWFVLTMNPDGYQYTFDEERFWRKNMRDNDSDGEITFNDGVDLNRNWPSERWGYDNEGSSPNITSFGYRGTEPGSEPEMQALVNLIEQIDFRFMIDYHSFGDLILYPYGWQVQTPSDDDAIFTALAGTDANPAIPAYDPGVGADLYIANGTSMDYAYDTHDILAFVIELTNGFGFVFPDDEEMIQEVFEQNLPFALDLLKSAADPAQPVSHLDSEVDDLYVDTFSVSYGDPQTVEATVARSLENINVNYQINDGEVQRMSATEWEGGERTGGDGIYYKTVRADISGASPSDTVTVFFSSNGVSSDSFTYTLVSDNDTQVLIVAEEDYTGAAPEQDATEPQYLSYYVDALNEIGIKPDIYDIDANERTAPHALGVLNHYDAVIWYTGDNIVTREPDMQPSTASRVTNELMLAMRAYLNEGGKLFYTGKYAGSPYAETYDFDPVANEPCGNDDEIDERCVPLSNDFLQYYLGAFAYNSPGGTIFDDEGNPTGLHDVEINQTIPTFTAPEWTFGTEGANNQDHSALLEVTSAILPADEFPQFDSTIAGRFTGGVLLPYDGNYLLASDQANLSYKRLTRTIDLTDATEATLSFRASYETEVDWDYFFVEAHTVDTDDWTTLPDQNGNTSTETGRSCLSGWNEIHPFIDSYQTYTPETDDTPATCTPTGTTGEWNAVSGPSDGWEEWVIDLSDYAGSEVEVSLAYASDSAVQRRGILLDDITISTGAETSFEDGLGGWEVAGPPEDSPENANNFTRVSRESIGEDIGAIITTEDTVYFGFGFEGIDTEEQRTTVMRETMAHLLGEELDLTRRYFLPIVGS